MAINLTDADVAEIERQFKALGEDGEAALSTLKKHIDWRNPLTGLTDAEHARLVHRLSAEGRAELIAQKRAAAEAGDAV